MSKYKITKYSYDIAKKYGLVIKPSTNVKKKLIYLEMMLK